MTVSRLPSTVMLSSPAVLFLAAGALAAVFVELTVAFFTSTGVGDEAGGWQVPTASDFVDFEPLAPYLAALPVQQWQYLRSDQWRALRLKIVSTRSRTGST